MRQSKLRAIILLLCFFFSTAMFALNDHIVVGYWHNFNNGAANGLKLSQVSDAWDVINLSFAEPTSSTSGQLVYNPTADGIYASAAEFKADVKATQAKGKKVVLSIGGEKGQVRLETTGARDAFINSAIQIIEEYGLDGLDIDFEGQSLRFEEGDLDLANPTTPVIVNLIYALNAICDHFGNDFLLTFAPETHFVQQAYGYYGTTCDGCDLRCGAYLPVLYAMRDRMSWLQVQYYNSGVINSPEGPQTCGTEDFVVYLAKMLADGFPIKDGADYLGTSHKLKGPKNFPALRQDQIVLGVPSVTGSAGAGTLNASAYISIMNKLRQMGYDIRGFMTWSINWDKHYNYEWSNPIRTYINSLNNGTAPEPVVPGNGDNGDDNSGDNGNGDNGNSNTGTSICDGIQAWDASKAYNVYNEDVNTQVVYNDKLWKYNASNGWQPAGVNPENTTYGAYWTLVGACSSSSNPGGNTDPGEDPSAGNDEPSYNDHVLTPCLKRHLLFGYWHNFTNGLTGSGERLKLADVSTKYDILNVSFAETDGGDRAVVTFHLDNGIYASEAQFIEDIKTCQARGQKVNISLGGQNGIISVTSAADKVKFVNSVIGIIEKYGFDGLDIDFEGTSAGGYSPAFDQPNQQAQYMIDAIREICDHFGDNFILTMAPETAYVQFGYMSSLAPAYMTLIHGLRDKLTCLHVQLYNTGNSSALDGKNYNPGTPDYLVAMCDMLLQGFPNSGKTFPALAESQVAIGVPTCTGAAGSGIVSVEDMAKALNYLLTGNKPAGMTYTLAKPGGYPNFRGLMTWSVNYDHGKINYNLANTISKLYDDFDGNPLENCGEVVADEEAPSTPTNLTANPSENSVVLSWTASTDNVAVRGYNIYKNGSKVGSTNKTTYTVSDLTASTEYTFEVEAYDAATNKSAKAQVNATTTEASVEPDPGTNPDPETGDCDVEAWDSNKVYDGAPGTFVVSHEGKVYENTGWYMSGGHVPGSSDRWQFLYNCGEGGSEGGNDNPDSGNGVDTGIDYEHGKKFVVYFPNWGTYNDAHLKISVGMIPWDKVTHINHAFWMVGDDNKVVTTDEFADFQKTFDHSEGWDKVDRLAGHLGEYNYYKKQYPNVKVMISVGGWTKGQNFHKMALTKDGRTTFIQSCIDLMRKYTFIDGIDIDWEYPGVDRAADPNDEADRGCPGGPEDKQNYTLMLKEMREAFDAAGMSNKLITVAATMNQNTIAQGANPNDYDEYVDFINIMTYDAHGAFESITNHHAAIYPNPNDPAPTAIEKQFNAYDAAMYYANCGVPRNKLIIGSPWYSRGWGQVDAGSNGDGLFQNAHGKYVGKWDAPSSPGGQTPWFEIKKLENDPNWTKYFDETSGVPYLYSKDRNFLTYEDERSLGIRIDLIKRENFGGLIVWEISGDDLNNGAPLTTIVYNNLLQSTGEEDTEAPTTPTNLQLQSTVNTIVASWTASTDNVGVKEYNVYLDGTKKATVSTTNYTFTGLEEKTTYVVAVEAVDEAGNISGQVSGQVITKEIPDTTSPSVPTNLIGNPSTNTIEASWNASTDNVGVKEYIVYLNNVLKSRVATTNYTFTGLTENTTYTIGVEAVDEAGNKSARASISIVTKVTPDTTSPSVPTNLIGNSSTNTIEASWSASTDNVGVKEYIVYLNDVEKSRVATTNYTFAGLSENTTYTIGVEAVDEAGNKSARASISVVTKVTPDTTSPSVPTNLIGNPSTNAIEASWTASTDNVGVKEYIVYLNDVEKSRVATTNYTFAGLSENTTYTIGVEAVDEAGNKSVRASISVVTKVTPDTTSPSVPTNLIGNPSTNTIVAIWSASTDNVGVKEYIVYLNDVEKSRVVTTNYTFAGLSENTTYTIGVEAVDEAGNKSAKASISVTTTETPDTIAPSVPTNLNTAVTTTDILATWTSSTDNVGVVGYNVYLDGTKVATVLNPSYKFVGLEENTLYTVRVEAFDAAGNKASASTFATTLKSADTEAPSTPSGLNTAVTTNTIVATWIASTDNVGVVGYNVYLDGTKVATVSSTSYKFVGLEEDNLYSITVEAFDAANNISLASSTIARTDKTPEKIDDISPTIPNIDIEVTKDSIKANWGSSYDESGIKEYNIYLNGALVGTTTKNGFEIGGLMPSTKYDFTLEVVDNNDNKVVTTIKVTTKDEEIEVEDPETAINAEDVNCQIYPNPASEIMFIEVSENAELRMYSLDGRLILAETLAEGNNQIEINNVRKGTYVVYVQGVSSKAVFKQVIY